jgi:hypothetical protein
VTEALRAPGARRIALVSPYPDRLTEWSRGCWQQGGFEVAALTTLGDVFRAYDASEGELAAAIVAVGTTEADAVLLDRHGRLYARRASAQRRRAARLERAPLLATLNPDLAAR